MKRAVNEREMVTVNEASKVLGVSKGKIKKMIKRNEIDYTLENCEYRVNVGSMVHLKYLNPLVNGYKDLISEIKDEVVGDTTINDMYKLFNRKPLESNTFRINWSVLKKFNIYEVDDITLKLLEIFPKDTHSVFSSVIEITHYEGFDNYDDVDYKQYSIFGIDNYVVVFSVGNNDYQNKFGYVIHNIFRKEEFEFEKYLSNNIILKKYQTLISDYNVDEINNSLKEFDNLTYLRMRDIENGIHLEKDNIIKKELMYMLNISENLFNSFIEGGFIGNDYNDTYTFSDMEILKYLVYYDKISDDYIICHNENGTLFINPMKIGEVP